MHAALNAVGRRLVLTAILALPAWALAGAPSAQAASVSLPGDGSLLFSGGPAEANALTITLAAGVYAITDRGATVTPGLGCVATPDPQTATCPAGGVSIVRVNTADLDDQVTLVGTGASEVVGVDGRDVLVGGPGPDRLFGAGGDDTLIGNDGADVLVAEALRDEVAGANELDGGAGPDVLLGGQGPDRLQGGSGEDLLAGLGGPDVLRGGDGGDRLSGGPGDDAVGGEAGDDELEARDPIRDEAIGSPGIAGDRGEDALDGGPGDDVLRPGPGPAGPATDADVVTGGTGRDTVTYETRPSGVTVSLDDQADDGAGGERDLVRPDVERLVGSSSADTLTGSPSNDTVDGGPGSDRVAGLGGSDALDGGSQDDAPDTLRGGKGDDRLVGNAGDDQLEGDRGDDEVAGAQGDDTLLGRDGRDRLTGGAGRDELAGGRGDDAVDGGAPVLLGFDGADQVRGGPGDDALLGAAGDDLLTGGPGADAMTGGDGSDTADYAFAEGAVSVTLDGLANDGPPGERDNLAAVENVTGAGVEDTLTGNGVANRLASGAGEDYLDGGGGRDTLRAGAGPDVLRARDGEFDRVFCGRSRDLAILDPGDRAVGCERVDLGEMTRLAPGEEVRVDPVAGTTEFGLPDASRTVPLRERLTLPTASQVDTTDGRVALTVPGRGRRGQRTAAFSQGRFRVRQDRSGVTELRLVGGGLDECATARTASSGQKRERRRLWGRGKGRYRTRGRGSSSTVRGTTWLTEDRCDGTLTRVVSGTVVVRDFARNRTVRVDAGERYLARLPAR